jgi:hypothetical protein
VFDFATVPKILWWKWPPCGDGKSMYALAAAFHDWLLEHKAIEGDAITRSQADDVFLEIMLYLEVDEHVAQIMYRAVCLNAWLKEFFGAPFHAKEETPKENAT